MRRNSLWLMCVQLCACARECVCIYSCMGVFATPPPPLHTHTQHIHNIHTHTCMRTPIGLKIPAMQQDVLEEYSARHTITAGMLQELQAAPASLPVEPQEAPASPVEPSAALLSSSSSSCVLTEEFCPICHEEWREGEVGMRDCA